PLPPAAAGATGRARAVSGSRSSPRVPSVVVPPSVVVRIVGDQALHPPGNAAMPLPIGPRDDPDDPAPQGDAIPRSEVAAQGLHQADHPLGPLRRSSLHCGPAMPTDLPSPGAIL